MLKIYISGFSGKKKKLEEPPCWRQVVIASLNGTWFASEPTCLARVSI